MYYDISNQNLTSLTDYDFPSGIQTLNCSLNKLTDLVGCPDTVLYLDCQCNLLTSLRGCPPNVIILKCTDNDIEDIADLPRGLKELYCDYIPLGRPVVNSIQIGRGAVRHPIGEDPVIGTNYPYAENEPFTTTITTGTCSSIIGWDPDPINRQRRRVTDFKYNYFRRVNQLNNCQIYNYNKLAVQHNQPTIAITGPTEDDWRALMVAISSTYAVGSKQYRTCTEEYTR